MNRIAGLMILTILSFSVLACSREPAVAKTPDSASRSSGLSPKGAVLEAYLQVSSALAADDFSAAKSAAAQMTTLVQRDEVYKALSPRTEAVSKAAKIADARKEFQALSAAIEPLAAGDKTYVVMHCPMVNADWIQTSLDVKNPYYGKMMLTCGAPKETK